MANNTSNRGFAKMKKEDPKRQQDIAREGGESQGKDTNPANLANRSVQDRKRISKAGGEASHGGNS